MAMQTLVMLMIVIGFRHSANIEDRREPEPASVWYQQNNQMIPFTYPLPLVPKPVRTIRIKPNDQ
jgi:hypothetical protein